MSQWSNPKTMKYMYKSVLRSHTHNTEQTKGFCLAQTFNATCMYIGSTSHARLFSEIVSLRFILLNGKLKHITAHTPILHPLTLTYTQQYAHNHIHKYITCLGCLSPFLCKGKNVCCVLNSFHLHLFFFFSRLITYDKHELKWKDVSSYCSLKVCFMSLFLYFPDTKMSNQVGEGAAF